MRTSPNGMRRLEKRPKGEAPHIGKCVAGSRRDLRLHRKDNPDAAARTIEQILESAERLLEYPKLGKAGRVRGTRELVQRPFVIVYRVLEDVINIEAVLHGSRIESEPRA